MIVTRVPFISAIFPTHHQTELFKEEPLQEKV